MTTLASRLVAWTLALLLAVPLLAYQVVLKDGRVIQFQQYRVQQNVLFYITKEGKESSVRLADINMEHTRQLNASESPPLELPGLTTPTTGPNAQRQMSLGEVARRLRKERTNTGARKVFTNDEVASSSSSAGISTVGRPRQRSGGQRSWQDEAIAMRTLLGTVKGLSARQLARNVLGDLDVSFPGRREWEERLSAQMEALAESIRDLLKKEKDYQNLKDILQRARSRTKGDEMKLQQREQAALQALSRGRREMYRYNALVKEGRSRAAEWRSR